MSTVYLFTADVDVETENGIETRTYVGTYDFGIGEDDYYVSSDMTVIDVTERTDYQKSVFSDAEKFSELSKKYKSGSINDVEIGEYVFSKADSTDGYYKITATVDGFIDLILVTDPAVQSAKTTAKRDLSLYVTKYSEYASVEEMPVYTFSASGTGNIEYVRFYAFEGEEYIVNVKSPSASGTGYSVMAAATASPPWFPQYMSSESGVTFWNSTHLDKLYFGTKKFVDPTKPNSSTDMLNKDGCTLCSWALILRRLNKSTSTAKFDIRNYPLGTVSGQGTTLLQADPYSAMLVNNGYSGSGYTYSSNKYTGPSGATVGVSWENMASSSGGFNVTYGTTTTITITGSTNESKYNNLLVAISSVIDSKPQGILLYFSGHTIVVAKVDGTLRVFDSGRVSGETWSNDTARYYNVPLYTYFVTWAVRPMSNINGYKTIG